MPPSPHAPGPSPGSQAEESPVRPDLMTPSASGPKPCLIDTIRAQSGSCDLQSAEPAADDAGAGRLLHASVRASGHDAVPWPEWLRGHPALVIPQVPGLPRPVDPGAGWTDSPQEAAGQPHPGWQLTLNNRRLTITGPDTAPWYDGYPLLTREWMRAAVAQRQALLVTGAFAHIDEFAAAAANRALRLLLVAVR